MKTTTTLHHDLRMQKQEYRRAESAVFHRTKDEHGGLSNMAGGFPLLVNDIQIRTSEALYQACRFPHHPEIQTKIIEVKSPMTAKMKSKPYRRDFCRRDWNSVQAKIMRWCLQVKLAQNWGKFSRLLLETGDRPIVEYSRRDDFWGAKPIDDQILFGLNTLGRLLVELRERVKWESRQTLQHVEPLQIKDFLLYKKEIAVIKPRLAFNNPGKQGLNQRQLQLITAK